MTGMEIYKALSVALYPERQVARPASREEAVAGLAGLLDDLRGAVVVWRTYEHELGLVALALGLKGHDVAGISKHILGRIRPQTTVADPGMAAVSFRRPVSAAQLDWEDQHR